MKRCVIRDVNERSSPESAPDFASLHPGYKRNCGARRRPTSLKAHALRSRESASTLAHRQVMITRSRDSINLGHVPSRTYSIVKQPGGLFVARISLRFIRATSRHASSPRMSLAPGLAVSFLFL